MPGSATAEVQEETPEIFQPYEAGGGQDLSRPETLRWALENPYAVTAELCRRAFYRFMHEFWYEVSNDPPVWNWHIELMCKELTKLAVLVAHGIPKKHDLVINIPPGTTKSKTASVMFPAWCWTKWPWMKFITGSYSSPLALELAEDSRDLIRSDKFQKVFPYIRIKRDKDKKSNFKVEFWEADSGHPEGGMWRNGGNRFSTSVGATAMGFHAHIIIIDDPLDPHHAVSDVSVKTANRWIDQTLPTRKVDKAVTATALIQQRVHQNDPSGHILERRKNIKLICLPGEIVNYAEKVHPPELAKKYVNGLLDPVRMPMSVLKDLEAELGQYGYAGQIGQDPSPPKGGMFKVDHFTTIPSMPPPVAIIATVWYWDKAATEDGGAYTAGVGMHLLQTGKYLVSKVKRGQWDTDEREAIMLETMQGQRETIKRFKIRIEQEPGSGGKDSVKASIKNLAGFSAYADRPTGNKVYRADPYSVQVNNGNVLLLEGDWVQPFIEEHRFFPFGTFKDQVDAGSGAFKWLTAKKKVQSLTKSMAGRRGR
jgi:predicted phage terminase large subunit-like protein